MPPGLTFSPIEQTQALVLVLESLGGSLTSCLSEHTWKVNSCHWLCFLPKEMCMLPEVCLSGFYCLFFLVCQMADLTKFGKKIALISQENIQCSMTAGITPSSDNCMLVLETEEM